METPTHAPRSLLRPSLTPTKLLSPRMLPSFQRFLDTSSPVWSPKLNPFLNPLEPTCKSFAGERCARLGCTRFAKISQLCLQHVREIMTPRTLSRAQSPTASEKAKHVNRRCKHEACEKYALAGGYCIGHGGGKRCQEANCHTIAQSGGYCKFHGGGTRCREDGCTRIAKRKG
ncbi:hypothetical protein SPRG_15618, partial [Saprolegnia parasitica CBS 223.65]